MTLYIYRVRWTYPARNSFTDLNLKNSNCTRTPPRPVTPVGPTGHTGRSLPDRPQCLDRSDCSVRPVRPVCANFDCQHRPHHFALACPIIAVFWGRTMSCVWSLSFFPLFPRTDGLDWWNISANGLYSATADYNLCGKKKRAMHYFSTHDDINADIAPFGLYLSLRFLFDTTVWCRSI